MGNWYSIYISNNKVDGPCNIIVQQGSNTGSITQNSNQPASLIDPLQLFGFPQLNENIVGREADVEFLLRLIKDQHRVLITGIGGIGKTTLASLCATTWVSNKEFKYAIFINVETNDSATNGFKALAKKIFPNTDTSITEIFEHYNELPGKTLFVLDNIEEKYTIHQYLPAKKLSNVFVLGTSQYTEFKRTFKRIHELGTLSINSSIEMIREVLLNLEEPIVINENITHLISDIAEILNCHPLALDHAAAYIADCVLHDEMSVLASVEHYIKTFNERLEKEPVPDHPTTYRKSVYAALKMNIEKATSKREDACKLLFCLSYFDPTYINIDMFYLHPDFNRERIKAPIRELKKYSIISLNDNIISLHRLIPTVYRDLIKKKNTDNNHILELLNILFYVDNFYIRIHFSYLIQNLNIDKKTMTTLYMKAFHSNDRIVNHLTARLRLINCDMNDITDWSTLHCSVFAGHETFFKYFDTSSCDDRLERFASGTWTVFHAQIIRNSDTALFSRENNINLISFFRFNENKKNKKIVKGLTTLHLCAAFNINKYYFIKLIDMGCDVNIPDDSGMTPILYGAKNMAYKLVFILHRTGATYDQSYEELLSAASNNNHESVLALLRTRDIDCAASDFSKTLLHWAVDYSHSDIALELIKRHTDINGTDSRGDTPLFVAVRREHSEVTLELLRHGANIKTINNDGDTPLMVAARWGRSEVALELLHRGANIEATNNDGDTPLLVAAGKELREVIVELLHHGANIETINNDGDTPLLATAQERRRGAALKFLRRGDTRLLVNAQGRHSEIALELLRRGANIQTINNRGDTPLLAAAEGGHSEVALELLRRGANIETSNNDGDTPLLMAAKRRLSEVALELLRRGANIEAINNYGETPLLAAAHEGLSEVALELLRRGANIEAINNYGETPLWAAAHEGLSEVALELLRRGANIETTNILGDTPLLAAAWGGLSEVALELLRRGANIETTNNDGDTPLMVAAKWGHSEVALELLRRGANIETTSNDGDTPLMVAAKWGHSEVALELLRHGANIETSDNDGNTPLLVVAKRRLSEVALELLRRGANIETTNTDGETPLLAAAKNEQSEVALELLRRGANIETTNNAGDTPLMVATRWGRSEVALELLRRGANIETTNNRGETPLLAAAKNGHSEVVLELLRCGANIEATNNDGYTPLLVAADKGLSEVIVELLCRGANIDAKNKWGRTALSLAVLWSRSTIVKLLNEHKAKTGDEPS